MINDEDNDEKCCIELNIKDIKKGTVYGNNEKTIEQLSEEDLFNIINKRLINVIINKMKNEGVENALYKLIEEKNISETFVSQVLRYVMDSIVEYKCILNYASYVPNSQLLDLTFSFA